MQTNRRKVSIYIDGDLGGEWECFSYRPKYKAIHGTPSCGMNRELDRIKSATKLGKCQSPGGRKGCVTSILWSDQNLYQEYHNGQTSCA